MGRRPDAVRKHFQKLEAAKDAEKDKEKKTKIIIGKIHGSVIGLRRHLERCPYTPEARMSRAASSSLEPGATTSTTAESDQFAPLLPERVKLFHRRLLEFQAEHRLPGVFIERGTTARLIECINPHATEHLPSRRQFGGPMLDAFAEEVINEEATMGMSLQRQSGGRVNFLSDIWQNIAKVHLLGAQLALFGVLITLGLFATASRHDGLDLAQRMETRMLDAQAKGWKIGGVVTDDAGQCGRARRILALRWPNVVFVKCFAHDMNNLVKSILRADSFRRVSKDAQRVVRFLNASTAKWLPRAQEIMVQTYGNYWQFITLCPTRWNSMQGCFASLLWVQTALRMFAVKYRNDAEFNSTLSVLDDNTFWSSLEDAEHVINPIAFASYKLQSDENTLADVVIVFRDLYEKFSTSSYNDELLKLAEARWAACEQPLFMLALYLHPAYYMDAARLVDTKVSGHASICKIADYYYRRLLNGDPGTLSGELDDWLSGTYMRGSPKELKHFETSSMPPLPAFWRHWQKQNPSHCLPKLALAVLSVTANTATCERYFSELALIHTALRNRMDPEKARKIAALRKYLRDQMSEKAVTPKPAKRMVSSKERPRISAFGTPERRSSSSRNTTPFFQVPSEGPDSEHMDIEPSVAANNEEGDDVYEIDDIVAHWETVLSAMEDGDESELQALFALVEALQRNEAAQGEEEVEEEIIPPPDRRPFPAEDDRHFPQERLVLKGLRGRKVPLAKLLAKDASGI